MEASWIPFLSTLAGGGLTLLGGWLANSRQIGAQRSAARRADLQALIADFLVQTDRLWRAVDGVVTSAHLAPRNAPMPAALLERLQEDGQTRQEAFLACQHALAKLDLIAPSLAPAARHLYEACSATHSITDKGFWTASRELAYEAFLEAARKELEIKPPSKSQRSPRD